MQLLVLTFLSASRVNTVIPIMAKKLHDENRFLQARDPEFVRELTAAQALEILERNDCFNPHLLVGTPFKRRLRKRFFRALLERVAAYEVNTTEQPEQSQTRIRKIVDLT